MTFKTFTQQNLNVTGRTYFIRRAFDIFIVSMMFVVFMAFANKETGNATDLNASVLTEPFLGQVAIFPFSFAPQGWAKCEGQLLPISQNQALFSLLGTTYGGDGETTFGLPDLRGRVVIGHGSGPGLPSYSLGQKGGITNTVLSIPNLPVHSHTASGTIQASSEDGEETSPVGNVPGMTAGVYNEDVNALMKTGGVNVTVNNAGSGQQFTNMQPYAAIGYYIALQGVYPSQN
jgi:microcystin-dependent protein